MLTSLDGHLDVGPKGSFFAILEKDGTQHHWCPCSEGNTHTHTLMPLIKEGKGPHRSEGRKSVTFFRVGAW